MCNSSKIRRPNSKENVESGVEQWDVAAREELPFEAVSVHRVLRIVDRFER